MFLAHKLVYFLSLLINAQVNDKEEALAHQRKVSYMLARAMEMKEDVLEQDRGGGALGSQLEARGSSGPVRTCCQKLPSQNSISSVPGAETRENPVKTLQKSHSWPSEKIIHVEKPTEPQ